MADKKIVNTLTITFETQEEANAFEAKLVGLMVAYAQDNKCKLPSRATVVKELVNKLA